MMLCLCATLLWNCGGKSDAGSPKPPVNGVYYWRTTYKTDSVENAFLHNNQIKRMYVRFFDVDVDNSNSGEKCLPVATIQLDDTLPADVEITPTVFITNKAIVHYNDFYNFLAHRIYAMCDNFCIEPSEVQFDCDWTSSTQKTYFYFLKKIGTELNNYFFEMQISATIRLHQLSQTPPPVDNGVLMCYNTGNFKTFGTQNSILDINDVEPYMKHLKKYKLPLSIALPAYSWNIEFDDKKEFLRLNREQYNFGDTNIKAVGKNTYEMEMPGESRIYIRHEEVSAETLKNVKQLILKHMSYKPDIILYHLDSKQIEKYSKDEISEIYR